MQHRLEQRTPKNMKTSLAKILAITAAGLLTLVGQANANTITPSVATVNSPGVWSYNSDLTSGQLVAGDGFTIFDFGGYVLGSIVAPANWTASVAIIGSPYGNSVTGDSGQFNLTFTYTGPTITQTVGAQTFTGFRATTTSLGTTFAGWASRDHQPDGSIGTIHEDIILVPSGVPDGGTAVALLGLGMVAIGALRRKLAA
jgi:hypothetical protein